MIRSDKALPRVLIIGQPFNNNSGGGITQANLFSNWDKENIAVVCTMHMFNNLNIQICDTYYVLGKEEYKWVFPFNFLQRQTMSGERKLKSSLTATTGKPSVKPGIRARLIDRYFYPFLEFAGLIHCISTIELSGRLKQWITAYNPDIIYAQASTRETVKFCTLIKTYLQKPMVFHMMDDWPSTISEKGLFKNIWKKIIDREFRELLRCSDLLLSISHEMASAYKVRYGREFMTFHNPIDISFWKRNQKKDLQLNPQPYILYAGRIGPGIRQSLEMMAKAVGLFNMSSQVKLTFILQTKEIPEWAEKYPHVQHHSLVPYEELPKVFGLADFLFLPYDFDQEALKFIRYSMPTKAPEYMISGTPIIIMAPEETALVKDALQGNWAKVVVTHDLEVLTASLRDMVENFEKRELVTANAKRIAEKSYDANSIRESFCEVICSQASDAKRGTVALKT